MRPEFKMTTELSSLLSELREDHRNMAVLLTLLDHELGHILEADEPDFELAHDIMRYMTVYSDAVHHPKEDVLYARMRAQNPDLAAGLERVEQDHDEIARLGETLRNDIEAIISGAAVTREQFVSDTRDYVRRLRQHMTWEEDDLFQRADALLEEDPSVAVDVSHLGYKDPVFGTKRERSFANLLHHIELHARDL